MKTEERAKRRRFDRAMQFVIALAGGSAALRGCGGGGVSCLCPSADGGMATITPGICQVEMVDAGCNALYSGSGPLDPPELA